MSLDESRIDPRFKKDRLSFSSDPSVAKWEDLILKPDIARYEGTFKTRNVRLKKLDNSLTGSSFLTLIEEILRGLWDVSYVRGPVLGFMVFDFWLLLCPRAHLVVWLPREPITPSRSTHSCFTNQLTLSEETGQFINQSVKSQCPVSLWITGCCFPLDLMCY